MFIGILNQEQRENLCRIVQYIASCDGETHAQEAAITGALALETGLDEVPSSAADLDEVEGLLKAFDAPHTRRALVLESLGVALADANLHPEELKVIQAMAKGLELDEAWVETARDYVQRAIDLQREGAELVVG